MGYAHIGGGLVFTKLFGLILLLGIILFLVWAIRTLDKKQLKKWVIGLVVVGLLGMVGSSLLMKTGKWDKKGFDKDAYTKESHFKEDCVKEGMESKIEYCEKLLEEKEVS